MRCRQYNRFFRALPANPAGPQEPDGLIQTMQVPTCIRVVRQPNNYTCIAVI